MPAYARVRLRFGILRTTSIRAQCEAVMERRRIRGGEERNRCIDKAEYNEKCEDTERASVRQRSRAVRAREEGHEV